MFLILDKCAGKRLLLNIIKRRSIWPTVTNEPARQPFSASSIWIKYPLIPSVITIKDPCPFRLHESLILVEISGIEPLTLECHSSALPAELYPHIQFPGIFYWALPKIIYPILITLAKPYTIIYDF